MRSDTTTLIEMPQLRILNANFDTPNRQFPVGTTIQLTCQGEIGSDASKVSILYLQESETFIWIFQNLRALLRFQSFFFLLHCLQCFSNAFSDSRKVKSKILGLFFLVMLT